MKVRVTFLGAAALAVGLALSGAAFAQNRPSSQDPQANPSQSQRQGTAEVRSFSGKIAKDANGSYILQDDASKASLALDDQTKAKKFDGKNVVVTGTLDSSSNMIHVQKIEGA